MKEDLNCHPDGLPVDNVGHHEKVRHVSEGVHEIVIIHPNETILHFIARRNIKVNFAH